MAAQACDDEYEYGCAKAYDVLDYDTVEECKEDYNCGEFDPVTATQCPVQLDTFESIPVDVECGRAVGWEQTSFGDCWLDTTLYMMFGTKTFTIFNEILEGASRDARFSDTILLLRNYLIGLYNPEYSRKDDEWVSNCKIKDKWNLFMDENGILNIMERIGEVNMNLYSGLLGINKAGQTISHGSCKLIIDFIILLNTKLYGNDRKLKYLFAYGARDKSINDFVTTSIDDNLSNLDSNACLILHRVGGSDIPLVINDIINYKTFKLKSIIVGLGAHYFGFFICNDTTWYEYNNQGIGTITGIEPYEKYPGSPRVKILDDIDKINTLADGQGPDEIILFYESPKIGKPAKLGGGNHKSKRKKSRKYTKKIRKSKKNTKRRKRRRRTKRK